MSLLLLFFITCLRNYFAFEALKTWCTCLSRVSHSTLRLITVWEFLIFWYLFKFPSVCGVWGRSCLFCEEMKQYCVEQAQKSRWAVVWIDKSMTWFSFPFWTGTSSAAGKRVLKEDFLITKLFCYYYGHRLSVPCFGYSSL